MTIKKGTHSKVEGPFKSFIMGVGLFGILGGGVTIYNGEAGAGALVLIGSILAVWLGSKIPDKNRVEW